MATYKHLRSSTANKRPTTSIADGQLAINNNSTSAGLFFKDSTGATIIKIGPVHVGTTAPNATPGAGGSSGNSTGEVWLDTSLTPVGVKIWNGSAWVNGTPTGSTTVQGLLELATDVETQAGSDAARAVTPAGLQSKVSDSTSTTSSTTIASSTAVKSAYDLANAALPKSGGTVTGNLEIGTTGSLTFEGSTADGFETTLAVVDPTGDRTITLPNISGTVVTTGDTGTVTSTMLLDGTIVNADINASAAIAGTKISPDFGSQTVQTTGIVSHALGTALAPTVTFTGDTNTGLYSPGADQVAISTNGTQRLTIDGSGNVISAGDLYANGANGVVLFNAEPGNYNISRSGGDLTFKGTGNVFVRAGGTGANNAEIVYASSPYIAFKTANSERMRLDSSGRLGLGSSSPQAKLESYFSSTNPSLSSSSGAGLSVSGTSTVRLNLGNYPGAPYSSWIQSSDNAGTAYPLVLNPLGGAVGIGTTSPSRPLHVSSSGSEQVILSSTSGSLAGIFFEPNGTTYTPFFGATGNSLVSYTQGLERARIDSSGRLLVGTSTTRDLTGTGNTPLVQAEVVGAGASGELYCGTRNAPDIYGASLALVKTRGTTAGSFTVVQSGDYLGTVSFWGADGSALKAAASINAFVDGTPGANDMPGRLVFSTTSDSASSPSERLRVTSDGYLRLSSSSPGIQFGGDTAAANALDDYEEGTFTPTLRDSLGGTGTLSEAYGKYTKIGRTVFVQVHTTISSTTGLTSGQYLYVGGAPFTCSSNNTTVLSCPNFGGVPFSGYTVTTIAANSTDFAFSKVTSNASYTPHLVSDFGSGDIIQFSGWYMV